MRAARQTVSLTRPDLAALRTSSIGQRAYAQKVLATESSDPRAVPSKSITPKLSDDYKHTGLSDTPVPDLFSLRGKGIIVTGGGRGLGLMVANAAMQSGSPAVYCLDIADTPDKGEWPAAQDLADKMGSQLEFRKVDITAEGAVNEVIGRIYEDSEHPVCGYFGSAGMIHRISALDYPAESFRRVLDVNTTGSFLTMRSTAREMIKRNIRGSMALVASMSGTVTNHGVTSVAYNTSKAACLQLARSCAAEWGSHGIRVNTLSPGYIRTALTDKLLAEEPKLEEIWLGGSMLHRLSTPDEFRGPAIYLLSDASSFMTGSDLRVDGGHTAY